MCISGPFRPSEFVSTPFLDESPRNIRSNLRPQSEIMREDSGDCQNSCHQEEVRVLADAGQQEHIESAACQHV